MKRKLKGNYTFLLGREGKKIINISLSPWKFYLILTALLIFLGAVGFSTFISFRFYYKFAELGLLKKRNAYLEEENKKIAKLERELKELKRTRNKIEVMLGMKKVKEIPDFTKDVFSTPYFEVTEMPFDTANDSLSPELKKEMIKQWKEQWRFRPSIPPTVNFVVTRTYSKEHPGIDYAVREGTPVYATADGVVKEVGYDSVFGKYIKLKHGEYYETFYGHLSKIIKKEGDSVKVHDIIGFSGSTGKSTAPHLHFEISYKGMKMDPKEVFVPRTVVRTVERKEEEENGKE